MSEDVARKKLAHVIAIGISPDKEAKGEEKAEGEEGEMPAGLEAAMEEFLAAVDKKDAAGMAAAFHSAQQLCC